MTTNYTGTPRPTATIRGSAMGPTPNPNKSWQAMYGALRDAKPQPHKPTLADDMTPSGMVAQAYEILCGVVASNRKRKAATHLLTVDVCIALGDMVKTGRANIRTLTRLSSALRTCDADEASLARQALVVALLDKEAARNALSNLRTAARVRYEVTL